MVMKKLGEQSRAEAPWVNHDTRRGDGHANDLNQHQVIEHLIRELPKTDVS
jgi:hypothetical protein